MALGSAWFLWNGYSEGFRKNHKKSGALNVILPRREARMMAWFQIVSATVALFGAIYGLTKWFAMSPR